MINDLDTFNRCLGEIMMFSQFIEHDIKIIYANMLTGFPNENLERIKNQTLGETLINMQELDFGRKMNILKLDTYMSLKEITRIRNYWAHQAYSEFAYDDSLENFKISCIRLKNDINKLSSLQSEIEEIRINLLNQ